MNEITTADGGITFSEAGQGLPVVLLHAFPLCRDMWQLQMSFLARSHHVLAPDLRGFGGTRPFDGTPGVDRMADDVVALLTDRGIAEPAVLVGLSMGGYVALAFARRHPGRLRGLVLADTRAEADTPEARANRDQQIALAGQDTSAVAERMLPRLLGVDTQAERPEVAETVRRLAVRQTSVGIIGALQALRDRPDVTPHLSEIRVPALVLVGAEDVLTPPDVARALAGRIPNARVEVLPRAGHLSNLEQPEAFNAVVGSFLEALA